MLNVPYTSAGYLDIEAVRYLTASAPFTVIIGARQCGKTYGVLRSVLDRKERPVIIRRTKDERLKFANEHLTPLRPVDRSIIGATSGDMVTLYHKDHEAADGRGDVAGWVLDLNTARKRGFSLPQFDAVIYDECVPERHAGGAQDRAEAETFFQLLVTLFSNDPRFLSATEHPKVWILGNANATNAAIFSVLGLSDVLERMSRHHQHVYVNPQRAISVILADAPQRSALRETMPLMRAAASSAAKDMALHNQFIGDRTGIRGWPLRAFSALATFADQYGSYTVWIHKRRRQPMIYVTRGTFPARYRMPNTREAFTQLGKATAFKGAREFWSLVLRANSGVNAFYDSASSKEWFLSMRKG